MLLPTFYSLEETEGVQRVHQRPTAPYRSLLFEVPLLRGAWKSHEKKCQEGLLHRGAKQGFRLLPLPPVSPKESWG